MAKTKISNKGRPKQPSTSKSKVVGKDKLGRIRKDHSAHRNVRLQTWDVAQIDQAEAIWAEELKKAPHQRLSWRRIAQMVNLPKTTVAERLSGRRKGHGKIAGGHRRGRILTEGNFCCQAGQQAGHFSGTLYLWPAC